MEEDLWLKMTICGRRHSVQRRPSVEGALWWKIIFGGRRPSVEDDLQWNMTFSERQPSGEDNFWRKTILLCGLVRFTAFLWIAALLAFGHNNFWMPTSKKIPPPFLH